MIDNEDTPTMQRPQAPKEADNATIIQVPDLPSEPSPEANEQTNPIMPPPVSEETETTLTPEQSTDDTASEEEVEQTPPPTVAVAPVAIPTMQGLPYASVEDLLAIHIVS